LKHFLPDISVSADAIDVDVAAIEDQVCRAEPFVVAGGAIPIEERSMSRVGRTAC
jgi:hypothetical protein